MPRPPRIDFPDAVYHVTTRGNGRTEIFWSDGIETGIETGTQLVFGCETSCVPFRFLLWNPSDVDRLKEFTHMYEDIRGFLPLEHVLQFL